MKQNRKNTTRNCLLWWGFALVFCAGVLVFRYRQPQKLAALQQAVFGMDREDVQTVFGSVPEDKVVAVGVNNASSVH